MAPTASPPTWTNATDPNVDFDTHHRAYQTVLAFNAYWTNLHPNGAIYMSYGDDYGRTWQKGNHGEPLEHSPNQSSVASGHVEDKQWAAVDHFPSSPCRDDVYAAWAVLNGLAAKVRYAVSYDRGQTFSKARTLSAPSEVSPGSTFAYPSVGADGTVYAALVSFPPSGKPSNIYVTHSSDCGGTWAPFSFAGDVGLLPAASLPNTRFRDGIVENFAASPTYRGHAYLTWENWDGTQMDVYFAQSEGFGKTWSHRLLVNDNVDLGAPTDQFQPQISCPEHADPCPVTFIGDYFGLAMSAANVYALFVSTHYPSAVTADEGGPVYYRQQVLAKVTRASVAIG